MNIVLKLIFGLLYYFSQSGFAQNYVVTIYFAGFNDFKQNNCL